MQQHTLCLHFPVNVPAHGRTFAGELFLPKAAKALRVCIVDEDQTWCRRLGSLLTSSTVATLTLRSDGAVSAGQLIDIVDWVRSRRLLRSLGIRILAPASDAAALQKARLFRPAAISA